MLRRLASVFFLTMLLLPYVKLHAQATSTQERRLALSAFAGFTGASTGLHSRNLSITGGGNLILHPDRRLSFALEARATHPLDRGSLVDESSTLFGPSVHYRYGRLKPYADFLLGRGSLDFGPNGYLDPHHPRTFYTVTDGNVFAPAVGLDASVSASFAVRLDAQFQRYQTPVAVSGHITATALTLGLRYAIPLGFHAR